MLWTIGHYHAKRYGCCGLMKVLGLGALTASVLGTMDVRSNPRQVIAGGMAGSASLITYNIFQNGHWFRFTKMNPYLILALLTMYGVYWDDKAAIGGMAGGYLALFLL